MNGLVQIAHTYVHTHGVVVFCTTLAVYQVALLNVPPYHTIPHHIIPCPTIPYNTPPYRTMPHHTAPVEFVLHILSHYHSLAWQWRPGVVYIPPDSLSDLVLHNLPKEKCTALTPEYQLTEISQSCKEHEGPVKICTSAR